MRLITVTRCLAIGLLAMGAIGLSGCNGKTTPMGAKTTTASDVVTVRVAGGASSTVYRRVNAPPMRFNFVAKFKAAGDWCKEHDRPESQCFLCGPKRFEKFAATYEAKTGHKPPKPAE